MICSKNKNLSNIATGITTDNRVNSLLEQKIDLITEELPHNYSDGLYKLRIDNALSITDFILALKIEVNLSAHHIMNNIVCIIIDLLRLHEIMTAYKTVKYFFLPFIAQREKAQNHHC